MNALLVPLWAGKVGGLRCVGVSWPGNRRYVDTSVRMWTRRRRGPAELLRFCRLEKSNQWMSIRSAMLSKRKIRSKICAADRHALFTDRVPLKSTIEQGEAASTLHPLHLAVIHGAQFGKSGASCICGTSEHADESDVGEFLRCVGHSWQSSGRTVRKGSQVGSAVRARKSDRVLPTRKEIGVARAWFAEHVAAQAVRKRNGLQATGL